MAAVDLAARLASVSRWDSPKSVPVGQGRSGAHGGTVGTRGTAGASGTVGTRERSDDGIEEGAGMKADRVPAIYLDGWAHMKCQKPARDFAHLHHPGTGRNRPFADISDDQAHAKD